MADRPSPEERAERIAALKAQRATTAATDQMPGIGPVAESAPTRSATRSGRSTDWTTRVAVAGAATSAMFAMVTAFGLGANSVESAPAPAPLAAPSASPVQVGLSAQSDEVAMGSEADTPAPTPVSRTSGSR